MRTGTADPSMEIGFQIRMLSHMIKHTVNQIAFCGMQDEITGMHGWIMGYLYENRGKDIFQRDIQAKFSISRSTVTGILQTMEKNGWIIRESVDWDARLKKLSLTQKALQHHARVMDGIRRTEEALIHLLTEEERETFLALCRKIAQGIEDLEQKKSIEKEGIPND